jgi:glyoxylase-like metal-dependent hydrolase (beta-lactamase superfamily II)
MSYWCNLLAVILISFNIRQSLALNCDLDHPCPVGLECRFVSYLPGTKACVLKSTFSPNTPSKRNGRCPTTGLIQWLNPLATACNSNQDCTINKKCCPVSYGGAAYCIDTMAISRQPMVTPIIVGDAKPVDGGFDFIGSVTLVQSNGFNVLVDTGSARMTEELLQNLWSKAGLAAEDIDTMVTTHGHPDHYATMEPFSNIDQIFYEFKINGQIYKVTPLSTNQQFFLNDDRNVEIIKSPGHTLEDISVIVRNVPGFGTVSVVGDLMLNKNDGSDMFAQNKDLSNENRKKVACMSDYVVPGHGPMFQVDADQRSKFGCSTQ